MLDPITGEWRDDSGVPDPGMPIGMGDPTGGIVSQRPTPGPQAIAPSPMANATPQAPQQSFMGMQGPPIPSPYTPEQKSEMFSTMAKPEPWTPGKIATTAITAPLKGFAGLLAELHGALGIPTVADTAARYQAIYSNPNKTESRAFGVGTAEEPGFGDRFKGVWDGSARRTESAGLAMRQIVGARNQARKDAFRENKDVMQLQQGELNIKKGVFETEHQEALYNSQEASRAAARRSSNAGAVLSEMRAQAMRDKQAKVEALAAAIKANPELAQNTQALMDAAGGDLDLVNKALNAYASAHTLPGPSGLRPDQSLPLEAGIVEKGVQNFVEDRRTEEEKIADSEKDAVTLAREDAIRQQSQAREDAAAAATATGKTRDTARAALEGAFEDRELSMPRGWGTGDEEKFDFIQGLGREKTRLGEMLAAGTLSPAASQIIARRKGLTEEEEPGIARMLRSGELDADALNYAVGGLHEINRETGEQAPFAPPLAPSPTPAATPAPLPTRPVPTPRPESELPSAKGAAVLGDLLDRVTGKARTPTATPAPRPTTSASSESARQDNATRVTQFTARFDEKWKRERVPLGKPLHGPDYYLDLDRNLAAKGLKRETTD